MRKNILFAIVAAFIVIVVLNAFLLIQYVALGTANGTNPMPLLLVVDTLTMLGIYAGFQYLKKKK